MSKGELRLPDITAKEIAAKLGLSRSAVSLALNGKPGVSKKTREQVIALAKQHGYSIPNEAANTEKKTICFLIYVDQIVGIAQHTSFYTFVLQGVEASAKAIGYNLLVRYFYASQPFDQQVTGISGQVDGMIILGTDMVNDRRAELKSFISGNYFDFPVVVVDNFLFTSYVDCVGNDNQFGAKTAISYLLDQGHRRLGYLRAKHRIHVFNDRETGIHMALKEHAALELPPLEVVDVDISSEQAYLDICEWLRSAPSLPEALFAENDVVAAAAIRAMKSCGVRVPEDISIIGFDDVPICEMLDPTITTVKSFKDTIGDMAVQLLHRRIFGGDRLATEKDNGLIKISVSTKIVERNSVIRRR